MFVWVQEIVRNVIGQIFKFVEDFCYLLDDKSIDVVVIVMFYYWYCLIVIRVLQVGKDVYFEKLGSHVFCEGWLLVDVVRKYE